ncbi:MAG: hypothetical protein AAGF55_07390 [Pseudomonadota bacterium]
MKYEILIASAFVIVLFGTAHAGVAKLPDTPLELFPETPSSSNISTVQSSTYLQNPYERSFGMIKSGGKQSGVDQAVQNTGSKGGDKQGEFYQDPHKRNYGLRYK